jgi:hypothetical protein
MSRSDHTQDKVAAAAAILTGRGMYEVQRINSPSRSMLSTSDCRRIGAE